MKVDQPLRVLHLEDNARDAELVRDLLEAGGVVCDITRVQTREEFVASLQNGFDVILADYSLPSFDGMSALNIATQRSPDVPFIFVSGALGEEVAIEALKLGATDYVLKERLSRILSAVRGALRDAEYRAERKRGEETLRRSEERFRALVQFSFDVYWETDAEHRFTRQEFSERLTDAPARGAEIGKTRWEIPYVEPDEEVWRTHRATLDAHLRSGIDFARLARRAQAVRPFPASRCSMKSGASWATAASAGTSPSVSAPRLSTGRTSGSSSRWTGSTAPCREPTISST